MTEAFKRRERAKQIYQGAWWRAFLVLCLVLIPISAIAHRFLPQTLVSASIGIFGFSVVLGASFYAQKQVEKAGISRARVEKEAFAIEKISDAPSTEYRSRQSRSDGISTLIVCGLVLLGALWFRHIGQPIKPLGLEIVGYLVLGAMMFSAIAFLFNPVRLRFDQNGVCVHKFGFWPQKFNWNSLAGVEFQIVFNYLGEEAARQLVFKNAAGKVKTQFSFAELGLKQPETILADLRARLGAQIEPSMGNGSSL